MHAENCLERINVHVTVNGRHVKYLVNHIAQIPQVIKHELRRPETITYDCSSREVPG